MPSQASERKHKVRILRETLTPDGMGGGVVSTGTYMEMWGKVTPVKGQESSQQGAIRTTFVYTLSVDNNPGTRAIRGDDRVQVLTQDGQPVYNIRAVGENGSEGTYLDMIIERGVTQ